MGFTGGRAGGYTGNCRPFISTELLMTELRQRILKAVKHGLNSRLAASHGGLRTQRASALQMSTSLPGCMGTDWQVR